MISIILAAGKGSRMKSNLSKLVHKVNGIPMVVKVDKILKNSGISNNILVLGYLKEQVLELMPTSEYIVQEEQLGTAHAIMSSKKIIENYKEDILICNGDAPLLTSETILKMKEKFSNENYDLLLLSAKVKNPTGYGRIIKKEDRVVDIREDIDATDLEKKINEVNAGVYIFKRESLLGILDKFSNDNKKGEYYLTEAVKLLKDKKVGSFLIEDENEMLGVNSKNELAVVSKILRDRKNLKLMEDGVILIDPNTTYIEDEVVIGKDTTIYPNVTISGKSNIGENCIIHSNTRIENSIISNNVKIDNSVVLNSFIDENVNIGPFAHIRPDSNISKNVKIGNFVEIKKSLLKEGSKVNHLTYIGDSEVGKNTNIGAGSITCNYDGIKKHKTVIGDSCFIGSNTIMVAPLNIGDNSFTAAGSVITKEVPKNTLAFGRAKQINKENK